MPDKYEIELHGCAEIEDTEPTPLGQDYDPDMEDDIKNTAKNGENEV